MPIGSTYYIIFSSNWHIPGIFTSHRSLTKAILSLERAKELCKLLLLQFHNVPKAHCAELCKMQFPVTGLFLAILSKALYCWVHSYIRETAPCREYLKTNRTCMLINHRQVIAYVFQVIRHFI